MEFNLIALAIPFFFLLIGVELIVARVQRRSVYRFADAISDLSCGIGSQLFAFFTKALTLFAYVWLHEHHAVWRPEGWVLWVVAMVGIDLMYYWFHRASHRVNLFWACHIVHHQSEDYNLAVALRQSWFGGLLSWVFYLPLALLGVPPVIFVAAYSINLLYQFWVHTETIRRLGPLEWFLVTPSNHRAHHAVNREYIDHNYAGILLWDRLFGTFVDERDRCVYGTVTPLGTWSSTWANVHYWIALGRRAAAARSLKDKLLIWLAPPAWRGASEPPVERKSPPPVDERVKYDTSLPRGMAAYLTAAFVPAAGVLVALLFFEASLPLWLQLGAAVFVVWNLVAWGALTDRRRWGVSAEVARIAVTAAAGVVLAVIAPAWLPVGIAAVVLAVVQGPWIARFRSVG